MRTVVFGLDGASFNLLTPMIEKGKLPNIKRILRGGAHSDMESSLPPVTSPNWKCYSTGKNPGKLGIFWWENIDVANRRVYFPGSRATGCKEIWDYLGEHGYTAGVINTPLTYPPKRVNGFIVSGGPDAPEHGYAYPPEVEATLKKKLNYRVNSKWLNQLGEKEEKVVEEILGLIKSRFEAAKILVDRYQPDFLQVSIFYINTLQHYFYDNEYVERGWQIIDENMGSFLDGDTNIVLMSDHGTNEIEQVFYINSWLEREGYLRLKSMPGKRLLYRLGINRRRMWNLAQRLGVLEIVKKHIPKSVTASLPTTSGTIVKEGKSSVIDWERSRAVASGQGPVYLNAGKEEREKLSREIARKLEALRNPMTGRAVANRVYTREEIYSGAYLHEAPDLIIDQSPGTHIRGSVGNANLFESASGWRAENRRQGIFAAYGPDIAPCEIRNPSILDLAPTILALHGISRPQNMDGRVLPCVEEKPLESHSEKEGIREILRRKKL